jgi:uncharacterized protein YuzE
MNIRYFPDTDTALLEFTERAVAHTIEIAEDVLADIDSHGRLVNLTIEHAQRTARIKELSFREIASTGHSLVVNEQPTP